MVVVTVGLCLLAGHSYSDFKASASYFTEISKLDYNLSMRAIFIIPLLLMSLMPVPSWGLSMDDLVEHDGLFYQKLSKIPFTGEVQGERQSKGFIKNGKREGFWVIRNSFGEKSAVGIFKNGREDGLWEYYSYGGQRIYRGHYKNGSREGFWDGYHGNDQLWVLNKYNNGMKDGFSLTFHDNGQINSKVTHSSLDPLYRYDEVYDENGQLMMQGAWKYFKRGDTWRVERVGFWEFFNEDGTLDEWITGTYKNDKIVRE